MIYNVSMYVTRDITGGFMPANLRIAILKQELIK